MKSPRIYLIIISCTCALISCSKGLDKLTNPGDSVLSSTDDRGIPLELREAYWNDASILAVRQINSEGGEQNDKVELPQDRIRFYYDVLVRVYNAKRLSARDDVALKHNIHAHEIPRVREICMSVADTVTWVQNWMLGNRLTGNPTVDTLVQKYDLMPSRVQHALDQYGVVLNAGRPLNIMALAAYFSSIPGVRYAEGDNDITDVQPTDIWAEVYSDKVLIHYYKSIPIEREWCFSVYAYGLVVFEDTG